MKIFKEGVYKMFERYLQGPAEHNGIEEALRGINGDPRLQKLVHEYAKKNAITQRAWGKYGHGSVHDGSFRRLDIEFWRDPRTELRPTTLVLCPDSTSVIAPIFLHAQEDDRERAYIVRERDGGFYLTAESSYGVSGKYSNRRILDTGLFDGTCSRFIIGGLEEAIRKLTGNAKRPEDSRSQSES